MPDHAPEALHEVAPALDQLRLALAPLDTVVGLADRDRVGAGDGGGVDTVTPREALPVPPAPVHVNEKVLSEVSGPVLCEPDNAFAPDHAPLAEHEVALFDDQERVEPFPLVTAEGFAASDTVGAGGAGFAATATVMDRVTVPPVPLHVSAYVVEVDSAPVSSEPDSAFGPDQPPDAVQEAAPLADQVSIAASPCPTLAALADSETLGADAAGTTSTVTEVELDPRSPEHSRVNVPEAVSGPVDSDPETAFGPDHAPEATHALASAAVQARTAVCPAATVAGVLVSETVGAFSPPQATIKNAAVRAASDRKALPHRAGIRM